MFICILCTVPISCDSKEHENNDQTFKTSKSLFDKRMNIKIANILHVHMYYSLHGTCV